FRLFGFRTPGRSPTPQSSKNRKNRISEPAAPPDVSPCSAFGSTGFLSPLPTPFAGSVHCYSVSGFVQSAQSVDDLLLPRIFRNAPPVSRLRMRGGVCRARPGARQRATPHVCAWQTVLDFTAFPLSGFPSPLRRGVSPPWRVATSLDQFQLPPPF